MKGCTHRAMILFDGAVDSHQRIILRNCTVGTLILCDFCIFDAKKKLKLLAMAFRPRSNMLNISFAMGFFPIQNQSNSSVGTLIFDGFRLFLTHLPYFLV